MTSPAELSDRYGAAPSQRRLLRVLVAGLAAAFLGWLAWTAWFYSMPAVRSSLVGFTVESPHRATAEVEVVLDDGVRATCTLRAVAEDKTAVGEASFTPTPGRNRVAVRTEREATSVESIGCTAPGQSRPR